jgi:hypothetical protein
MKKAPVLQVEEISGNQFPDLEAAQRASLPAMSESLQAVIRDLLARGVLVNVNGKITPAPVRGAGALNRQKASGTVSRYGGNG